MLVKSIDFPTSLEDIEDIENDNIDVFVELEDGHHYTVTLATVKNLKDLVSKKDVAGFAYHERLNYFSPGYPFIIVKKLTTEIIEETIKAYAEKDDGYWLKLYHFEHRIKTTVFDELRAEDNARNEYNDEYNKCLDKLDELYEKYQKKLNELNRFDNS